MAKQVNIFKMEGTIGDATFYKTQYGHLVREKGGVSADRIKNDPSFQRTRENMSDFAYTVQATKLAKNAFNMVTAQAPDNRAYTRLFKVIRQALRKDATNDRGKRTLNKDNIALLRNFEFNETALLDSSFKQTYRAVISRENHSATVTFSDFYPDTTLMAPKGATDFKFIAALSAIDFANGDRETVMAESDLFPIDGNLLNVDALTVALAASTNLPLFLVIGISFIQKDNGKSYFCKDEGHSAAKIVRIEI